MVAGEICVSSVLSFCVLGHVLGVAIPLLFWSFFLDKIKKSIHSITEVT